MKKITTIETLPCEKDICKKDDCAKCYTEHSRVEQVPENWEDLKKIALNLPKRKNGIYVILKHYLDNNEEFLSIRRGKYEICQITHNRIRFFSLAMEIDIQHSWMIIKGIMEEK